MSDKNIEQVSPDTSTYPVVITIARDFGAEGHEIGKMLSTELGIPLYDNEILVRASMRAGVTTDQIAAYDESLAAEVAAFLPDRVDTRSAADKLFKQMEGVVLDLGSTQSCIIEGRLSDYILRDNPNRISVLVTAPPRRARGDRACQARHHREEGQEAREAHAARSRDVLQALLRGQVDAPLREGRRGQPRPLWPSGLRGHPCGRIPHQGRGGRARQAGYRVGLPRFLCLRGTWSFDWVPYVRSRCRCTLTSCAPPCPR